MKRTIFLAVALLVTPAFAQHAKSACSEGNGWRSINGIQIEDAGTVGYPLRGWVGYTNTGDPVAGMTIECFSSDGKLRIASATTDAAGDFSVPSLKQGYYLLKATKKGASADPIFVRVSKQSNATACFVAEAE